MKDHLIIRENKYARVISHWRGFSYEVHEKVGNKWERLTLLYSGPGRDSRGKAIRAYNKLTKSKTQRRS